MTYFSKPRFKFYKRECSDLFLKNRAFEFKNNYKSIVLDNSYDVEKSHYFRQLREKQKLKIIYGITNKKLFSYYLRAKKNKKKLSENIISLLERRLDNIVYRLGFGSTRAESRQIVNHKCVFVNNCINNIPSVIINVGDVIRIKEKCKKQERIINSLNFCKNNSISFDWIFVDYDNFLGYLKKYPDKSDLFINVDENLVFDFYSK